MRECPNWSIMDVNQLTGLAVDRLAAAIISGDFSEKKLEHSIFWPFSVAAHLASVSFPEQQWRGGQRDLLSDNRQTIRIMSDFHLLICAIF